MGGFLGVAAIAMGVFMIWNRRHMAEENILFNNRRLAFLRRKHRYGEREYRHNLRAAWIVGAFSIVLGVYMLLSG
jgi:hypothetical protein